MFPSFAVERQTYAEIVILIFLLAFIVASQTFFYKWLTSRDANCKTQKLEKKPHVTICLPIDTLQPSVDIEITHNNVKLSILMNRLRNTDGAIPDVASYKEARYAPSYKAASHGFFDFEIHTPRSSVQRPDISSESENADDLPDLETDDDDDLPDLI